MPKIKLPVTGQEYEDAGSKFAEVGEHPSEVTACGWDTPGKSVKFEFRITDGPDAGKTGKLSAGIDAKSVWKFKEVAIALGMEVTISDDGVEFDPDECLGVQFLSVWEEQVDTRTPEQGGTGRKYTKPVGAKPAVA